MEPIELLGFIAATLTTVSFLPQAIKSWKTKSTKDISLPMYVLLTVGVVLWTVYGWFIGSWPIITANAIAFLIALSTLALKIRHG